MSDDCGTLLEEIQAERDTAQDNLLRLKLQLAHEIAVRTRVKREVKELREQLERVTRERDAALAQLSDDYEPICMGKWSGGSGLHRKHDTQCGVKAITFDDPFWYCDAHSPMHIKLRTERDELQLEVSSACAQIADGSRRREQLIRERDAALETLREIRKFSGGVGQTDRYVPAWITQLIKERHGSL